jgi:hypothetical protein
MTKGYLVLAQNSNTDYVRQAYYLARSLQHSQSYIKNISLVTNDNVPDNYKNVFDKIIPIPFGDQAQNSEWKIENRWKLYHASPYDETIVFDADILVTSDLKKCWEFIKGRDLFFTSQILDYRGNHIVDKVYRKTFIENQLPNIYSGMFYFRKSNYTHSFFKLLEYITYNWERFFFEVTPKFTQKFYSLDVASAIAIKILGIESDVVHSQSPFKFVHMKPALQGWFPIPGSCYSQVHSYFNKDKELYVGNYKQLGVFHYVEDCFLNKEIVENLDG